jgi:D-alanyl-D-alanine carboxypeptidase/D-alanyl-D-alanine-endopeptidase (penicillin-binding protein 4)
VVACAILVFAVALGFGLGFGITTQLRHATAKPAPPRPSLPVALGAVTAAPSPDPAAAGGPAGTAATPQGVRAAIGSLAHAPGLGARLLARVIDARTGRVLFDQAGSTAAAPASTGKLLTAAAILAVRRPTDRFTTTVLDAGHGTVVLVGGGDPTLAAARPGKPTTYPDAARLSALAAQVRAHHVTVRRIVVDDSLFFGPSVSPHWDATDIGTNYAAPITALMGDAAVIRPPGYARSTAPDLDAAKAFAALLGKPGLPIRTGRTPAGTTKLAQVESAPVAALVDQMLQTSDNVIADVLARQVAIAVHQPASFTGAVTAIRTVLGKLGVQVGDGMKDGSGLSSADRVSPAALAGVLRLIAGYGPPAAAQVRLVAAELPVGGWSGTLAERYTDGAEHFAAGRVRAKTGTLSTVSSLAGLVRDKSGRLLVFAFDADRAVGTYGAEAALDAITARLARCGC